MRIALYQPDIPQNTGSILRIAACFGLGVDIIEPCGFVFADRHFRRAGMDYLDLAHYRRFSSWSEFWTTRHAHRLVLMTTRGNVLYCDYPFADGDILLLGSESGGVPADVHAAASARLCIPMAIGARSLNVAVAAGIVTAEALRQTNSLPVMPAEELD